MARVMATARPTDGRRFRPGLKPRGHELELHGSVAAYTASLDEAEADIVDEVFGPAEEDDVDAKETAEELRQAMLAAERRLRERIKKEASDE